MGYGTIQAVLMGQLLDMKLLALLFLAKLVATSVSLSSGASGGIFSPSLFMGTAIGGAFGGLVATFWPNLSISIPEFAMVGMAGMVGGATGASVMAITMVFEMTRDYNIIVPLIVAVAISAGVRRALSQDSIYTIKLTRRGLSVPTEQHTNMYLVQHARDIMDGSISIFDASTSIMAVVRQLRAESPATHILVKKNDRIRGVVTLGPLLNACAMIESRGSLEDVASRNFILIREDEILRDVFLRMTRKKRYSVALVVRAGSGIPRIGDVIGVISRRQIADAVLKNFHA